MTTVRIPAVAGTWYPASAPALAAAVDECLARAATDLPGRLVALVAPHAGLIYSGPVAAHAYHLLANRPLDLVVLVGPSHFVSFEGVAIVASGRFDTPFGPADIDTAAASALLAATPAVREHASAHAREHSLEMQLPFVRRLAPSARIVPLLMGFQTADTIRALGDALAAVLRDRPRALLIASSDLSHYHDAKAAARLDAVVMDCVERFDADALQQALDQRPDHACGGGPMIAVMRAARQLGARDARLLHYADSGDASGDKSSVVGYMAAALGNFDRDPELRRTDDDGPDRGRAS
jgi:MEMO1 family protein